MRASVGLEDRLQTIYESPRTLGCGSIRTAGGRTYAAQAREPVSGTLAAEARKPGLLLRSCGPQHVNRGAGVARGVPGIWAGRSEGGGLVGIQHRLFPPRFVMSSELNVDQAGICLICFGAIL
jgi:hypothetical protein